MAKKWSEALQSAVLALGESQLVTGISILVSGYIQLACGLCCIVLSLGICGGPRLFRVHHPLDDTYLPKVVFAEAACYPNVEIDMYGFHRGYVGYRIGIYRIF